MRDMRDEFRAKAIKQMIERGYPVAEVAQRLGCRATGYISGFATAGSAGRHARHNRMLACSARTNICVPSFAVSKRVRHPEKPPRILPRGKGKILVRAAHLEVSSTCRADSRPSDVIIYYAAPWP